MVEKKILLKNLKINLSIYKNNPLILFHCNKEVSACNFKLPSIKVVRNNECFLFRKFRKADALKFSKIIRNQCQNFTYQTYTFFGKVHMIGLGYKNFVLDNRLYILVGDCNYIIFQIPKSIKIFCKKNQIYMLSINKVELFNFISNLKKIKKPNFYKGKGILEFKNFKFTKLKVGKKQRFM